MKEKNNHPFALAMADFFCRNPVFAVLYDQQPISAVIMARLAMGARVKRQLIEVIYPDGTSGQVYNDVLDVLIATGKIVKFRRAEGWVDIIHDQAHLRDYRRDQDFPGQERRAPWPQAPTDTRT